MSAGPGIRAALDAHRYDVARALNPYVVGPATRETAIDALFAVLAPLYEEAAADGWDEGHAAGWFDARDLRDETPNPHRARREDAP